MNNPRNLPQRSVPGPTTPPSGQLGHAPSVFRAVASSHSPLVCRRAVPPVAHRFWSAEIPGCPPETHPRGLPTFRSVRTSRPPPQARPCWLAPVPMPPPAHHADRSDRIKRRIGTSAPAWPFDSASVSEKRVLWVAVRLHSPVSSGLRYAAILP